MNSKLLKASLAGVAALAVAAGGTTFAAWSDFDTVDNNVAGADVLALNLSGAVAPFTGVLQAPGVGSTIEREFVVASRVGESVPEATLRLRILDLLGIEDGCSSNSEGFAEGGVDAADPAAGCLDPLSEGQFPEESRVTISSTNVPTTDLANACNSGLHPRGGRQGSISLRALFNNTAATPVNLLAAGQTLSEGEGVCVGIAIQLPVTATNAVQGDSAEFDIEYLLDQIV